MTNPWMMQQQKHAIGKCFKPLINDLNYYFSIHFALKVFLVFVVNCELDFKSPCTHFC